MIWKWLERLSTVAVLACVVLLGWLHWVKATDTGNSLVPPEDPVSLAGAEILGNPQAPIALVIYSDFECPYCRRFARDTWPSFRKDYIDTGRVLAAFRHLPLKVHSYAQKAAEAAICAGRQDHFWQMHDLQFAAPGRLDRATQLNFARSVGLDDSGFQRCLDGQVTGQVRADVDGATSMGIKRTPTFLIGQTQQGAYVKVTSVIEGARPYEMFEGAVQSVYSEPSKAGRFAAWASIAAIALVGIMVALRWRRRGRVAAIG